MSESGVRARAVRSGEGSDLDLLVRLRIEFTYVGNDQKQLRRRIFDAITNNAEWLWLTEIVETTITG